MYFCKILGFTKQSLPRQRVFDVNHSILTAYGITAYEPEERLDGATALLGGSNEIPDLEGRKHRYRIYKHNLRKYERDRRGKRRSCKRLQ